MKTERARHNHQYTPAFELSGSLPIGNLRYFATASGQTIPLRKGRGRASVFILDGE